MSKIEDLQQSVREAVSNVDGISESLKAAREDLDMLTVELEGAVNAANEPISEPEPARVGDVVEIIASSTYATDHVGLAAVVLSRSAWEGYEIQVMIPAGKSRNRLTESIDMWNLKVGTYRVVARLAGCHGDHRYEYSVNS